jgi:uncharacterized protein (TIGR02145 family)
MKKLLLFGILSFSFISFGQTVGAGVTDIDGNNYPTVIIGDQEWMSENLRVIRYNNGDSIPNVTLDWEWNALTSGAYCWYNNDNQYDLEYGKLYNWYTVDDSRNVCPTGWRVPSDSDWSTFINSLDNSSDSTVNGIESTVAGGMLKETGLTYWDTPNTGATNSSGFSARSAGSRGSSAFDPTFGTHALWWSGNEGQSWEGISRWAIFDSANSGRGFNTKESGFSVRCMKDASGVGLIELNENERTLIKIVDLMGRETEFKPNAVLIYIYDDGSTERLMKIEE